MPGGDLGSLANVAPAAGLAEANFDWEEVCPIPGFSREYLDRQRRVAETFAAGLPCPGCALVAAPGNVMTGGAGNRLRGVITAFLISLLSDRAFFICWEPTTPIDALSIKVHGGRSDYKSQMAREGEFLLPRDLASFDWAAIDCSQGAMAARPRERLPCEKTPYAMNASFGSALIAGEAGGGADVLEFSCQDSFQ